MKKRSMLEWKSWPWLVVAGMMVVAAVVFYILAMNQEDPYPLRFNELYHCADIIKWTLLVVALLLLGITFYSLVYSRIHSDVRFKEVFGRSFNNYWIYYVLFVLLMIVVSCVWGYVCCHVMDYHEVFFKSSLWDDIKSAVFVAPLKEEAMYRLLPFLVAIIPMATVKSKRWRIVLGCFFGLILLCVQMQFGYIHVSIFEVSDYGFMQSLKKHLIIQGVEGMLYALFFGIVLYMAIREIMLRQQRPNIFKAVLFALPLAYLASCLVHGIYNLHSILSSVHS